MRYIVAFQAAFLLLGCDINSAVGATASPIDGFEVPKYGERESIIKVYASSDDNFVLQFIYYDGDGAKVDFYDTEHAKRLFPNQAAQIAKDNALQANLIRESGLKMIPTGGVSPVNLGSGIAIKLDGEDPKLCEWPFEWFFNIEGPDHSSVKKMIIARLPEPKTLIYQRWCGPGGGEQTLTTRYALATLSFFSDDKNGFYALVRPTRYLVHFDRWGNSSFFNGHDEVLLVSAEDLLSIEREAEKSAGSSQQFVGKSEAFIDSIGRRQMEKSK